MHHISGSDNDLGKILGTFWVLLGTVGNCWELLGTVGNFWELLGTFGNFWELLLENKD